MTLRNKTTGELVTLDPAITNRLILVDREGERFLGWRETVGGGGGRTHIQGERVEEGEAMTYYESAEGVRITKERAKREARDHGVCGPDWDEFLDYLDGVTGPDGMVEATVILGWLGY